MTTRTKIVATIGPASRSPETLRQLIDAGVSVFRLNFSHGTHDEHSAVLAAIRAASRDADREVAVLQDLCGPKMRLDPVPGDVLDCRQDDEFELVSHPAAGGSGRELSCSYRELPNDLKPGEDVLFADGTVAMQVAGTTPGRARLIVTQPGRLRSRQGLNLPRSNLAVRSLTEKDLADLDWTAQHKHDVDFVGLSFARSADDVVRLRRELESRGCKAQVVVKVERPQAVEQIEEIVAATDAVMVARGDLGVEIDLHRVPAVQKRVIALCNAAHRPVITATQMLNSMEHSRRPTRAEASDVFNAVLDGTDAVMLSGETAVGEFPVQAVATMRDICVEAGVLVRRHRRADRGIGERGVPDVRAVERGGDRRGHRLRTDGARAQQPQAGRDDPRAAAEPAGRATPQPVLGRDAGRAVGSVVGRTGPDRRHRLGAEARARGVRPPRGAPARPHRRPRRRARGPGWNDQVTRAGAIVTGD
jgi:pyruvate kinase